MVGVAVGEVEGDVEGNGVEGLAVGEVVGAAEGNSVGEAVVGNVVGDVAASATGASHASHVAHVAASIRVWYFIVTHTATPLGKYLRISRWRKFFATSKLCKFGNTATPN